MLSRDQVEYAESLTAVEMKQVYQNHERCSADPLGVEGIQGGGGWWLDGGGATNCFYWTFIAISWPWKDFECISGIFVCHEWPLMPLIAILFAI